MSKTTTPTHSVTNSGIEIEPAADVDDETWNRYVERSRHGTVFHSHQFLQATAEHADARLHRLVGYKGQEPVGVFPLFEMTKGFTTAVFSPPPDMGLSQMGPAMLNMAKLKARKAEKRTRRFLEGCLDWVDEVLSPSFVHLRTGTQMHDQRPFIWNDFEVAPRYTYLLDLTPDTDSLLDRFSSDARRNIRKTDDDAFQIVESGPEAVSDIVDHLQHRHDEQGVHYPVDGAFVEDLYSLLPAGAIRTYVVRVDDEYVGGMITLEDETTLFRWQGGARPRGDPDVPVNDLLDWRLITDAVDRGKERYDLVGANTPHLCEYKSKFGPELATYYTIKQSTRTMQMVSELYQRLK